MILNVQLATEIAAEWDWREVLALAVTQGI
jgi:hypothetical protein